MRAPLPAGCWVWGGTDARETPTKTGAAAPIMCHQHFREGLCDIALISGRKTCLGHSQTPSSGEGVTGQRGSGMSSENSQAPARGAKRRNGQRELQKG